MSSFNNVVLMGNLTRDPEMKFSAAGLPIAKMGLAMSRKYRDKSEQLVEERTFVDVTAFGKTADVASKYLKKGEPVLIEGRLHFSTWDAKDGSGKRSKLDVVAENLKLMPRRSGGGEGGFGFGGGPAFPGEFPAHAATASEDADEMEGFDDPDFGGGMPNDRK